MIPSFRFRNINLPVIRELACVGVPTGLQNFFEIGAFSVFRHYDWLVR